MKFREFITRLGKYLTSNRKREQAETIEQLLSWLRRLTTERDALKVQVERLQEERNNWMEAAERSARVFAAARVSGFYEVLHDGEEEQGGTGRPYLSPLTESQASDRIDMADCYGDTELVYLDENCLLLPVRVGQIERAEPDERGETPFRFAQAALIAGDQVRGYVTYTDH